MRVVVLLACLLANVALASTPIPAQESLQLLQNISTAARRVTYQGTFIFQREGRVISTRIYHLADHTGEYEKLVRLDGPAREIIFNGEDYQFYYPDQKSMMAERHDVARRGFPALLPEQLQTLSENYQVEDGGDERLAGYPAKVYRLMPKDGFRYGHKLWVDPATNLLLKVAMVGEDGGVIEQFAFTYVKIGGTLDRNLLKPSLPVKAPLLHNEHHRDAVQSGWEVDNLPSGFRKIAEMKRLFRGKSDPVTHLVYSDGIVAVSVFIESLKPGARPMEGVAKQGSVNLYARPDGLYQVTVVGEVPEVTVKQIGDSVAYKGKP